MAGKKVLKYTFTWRIKNFLFCYYKNGEELTSPVFAPEISGGSKWTIDFFPKGQNETAAEYMSCFLCKKENDKYSECVTIDSTIEICGPHGEVLVSYKPLNKVFGAGDSYGKRDLIKISEVEDKMKNWSEDTLIVRCHLFFNPNQYECEAETKFGSCKKSFLWNVRIPDESPEVNLISFTNNLQLEIRVIAADDDIKIVICLKGNKCSINKFFVGKMTLLDVKGNEVISKQATHLFEEESDLFEYPSFIKKQLLTDNKSSYVEDDCFSLWGEISVSNGIEYSRIQDSKTDWTFNATTAIQTLLGDLLNMFLLKKHSDVNLRVDNEIIPAHKSVLSARSPVFDAMFNQDMIESKTGIVDVLDVDIKTLKSFIEYVYTGTVKDVDYMSAKKLLILADRYQVTFLREECAAFLMSSISVRNVCEILDIADLVIHEQLKKSALDYIIIHSSKIFVSLEWDALLKNNPKLASEVISNIAVNFKFTPLHKTLK